jgi:hypothetical protein
VTPSISYIPSRACVEMNALRLSTVTGRRGRLRDRVSFTSEGHGSLARMPLFGEPDFNSPRWAGDLVLRPSWRRMQANTGRPRGDGACRESPGALASGREIRRAWRHSNGSGWDTGDMFMPGVVLARDQAGLDGHAADIRCRRRARCCSRYAGRLQRPRRPVPIHAVGRTVAWGRGKRAFAANGGGRKC